MYQILFLTFMTKNLKTTKVTKEKSRKEDCQKTKKLSFRILPFFEFLIRLKLLCLL